MHVYAGQSLNAAAAEPSTLVASSTDLGWRAGLLRIYKSGADCEPFETILTPDQTVVVHLAGHSELKVHSGGRWHAGIAQPGSVGLTPPNHRSRLRWRALDADGYVSAHLHVPTGFLEEATDYYARPRSPETTRHLNALSVNDKVVAATVRRIVAGLEASESELFVETAMHALACNLLHPSRTWSDNERTAYPVDDRRIRRAIEYMSYDLAAPINLSMVAREAAVSKFHFVRLFRDRIGIPPHTFLKRMRLATAQRMLRTSDLPVATIAKLVGYETPRNFSTAFARHFGTKPSSARHH